jgi:flagellar motility protein MotE (MotC chaperone)
MRATKATSRFLPALVLVLIAVLPAYVGSLWTGVAKLAFAEEAAPPATDHASAEPSIGPATTPPAPAADPAATTPAADDATGAETTDGEAADHDATTGHAAHGNASTEGEFDPLTLTKAEIDVLRQLAKRRDELTARERALDDREAMLKATEQRIAVQVEQMKQMKAEYQQMRTQRDEAAEASMRRLVTVYEAMKPEEAARIFETMEGAVLLDVVTRMGERRLAPILAQMSPAKAQALTIAMANRRAIIPAAQTGS